jgi:hypothetical protein
MGAVVLVIPIGIMAAVLAWAIPARIRYQRALHSSLATPRGDRAIGSFASITDPGSVPWRDLLDALAVAPEGNYHEGWMGTMLGLKTKWSTSTTVLEAHRMWGERNGREVKIRLGPDEKIEGGTELYSNKHIRAITTIEVALPEFELAGNAGKVEARGEVPAPVASLLKQLKPSPEIWHKLTVKAGPAGITANRPATVDPLNSWLYDLWLCERIASTLAV